MTGGRPRRPHPHPHPCRAAARIALAPMACLAVAIGIAPASAAPTVDRCGATEAARPLGTVADEGLTEISGVVASRTMASRWWVLEDSGAPPELTLLEPDGTTVATASVPGARNIDWEDLAIGPGPDSERSYLYIGDIGDNAARRPTVTVYRVVEPTEEELAATGGVGPLQTAEAFTLRYPNGPADAEALVVDPRTGDLYVLTKGLVSSTILHAPAEALVADQEITLNDRGSLRVPLVTAADIAPDGSELVVRNYLSVRAFTRPEGTTVADALVERGCTAPSTAERQGEAIAYSTTGDGYLTVSEGEHPSLFWFGLRPGIAGGASAPRPTPSSPAPTTAPDPDGAPASDAASTGADASAGAAIGEDAADGRSTTTLVVAAAAVAAIAAVGFAARSTLRRPR